MGKKRAGSLRYGRIRSSIPKTKNRPRSTRTSVQQEHDGGKLASTMTQPDHETLESDYPVSSNSLAPLDKHAQPPGQNVFRCSVPHCGKLFNRKEHLLRHFKSHNPHPRHECRICGRRYARSDVLKRHIENHPLNPHPRQPRMRPCNGCVERKTRCNGGTPCQACVRASVECIRPTVHWPLNLDDDSEVVTTNRDEIPHECLVNDNNDGSNVPQPATVPVADITSASATEAMLIRSTRPDISSVSPITLFSSSEQSTMRLASDSVDRYPWRLSSLEGIALHAAPTTNMVSSNLTAGLSLYQRLQWTDPQINLQSTVPTHIDLSLGAPEIGSHLDDLSTAFNSGVLSGNTNALSPQYSMLSPSPTQIFETVQDPQLQILDMQTQERLIESYFRDVHPCWPVLHQPTFSMAKCSPILLDSVLVLGSLAENGSEHLSLAPVAINSVMATQNVVVEQFLPLETLQAILLCLVYCITYPNRGETAFPTLRLHGFLIAALRCQQIFAGMDGLERQLVEQDAFQRWFAHEARNRLAYSCLRVDAYLSILLDHPPSVHYFELCIPLPKSARLWSARTAKERSSLQWSTPAGRESMLFCYILRDSLEEDNDKRHHYPLTGLDYHLGLCALQSGVWEAARKAHSFASDELSKLSPSEPIFTWRRHLHSWRWSMETDGRFMLNPSDADAANAANAADEEPFAPLTLILWHMACIKMHAPIAHLQASAALNSKNKRLTVAAAMPSANLAHLDICARIHNWVGVRCARVSCWNAAQIARVICHETADPVRAQRLRLNPLACHGLFMAAVVVASYAFYFQSCGGCVVDASGLPPVVDLFLAAEGDETLQMWRDSGNGYAVWGPKRIPLCRCKMVNLVAWLRTILASMDKDLAASFVAFTEKLTFD